MLVNSIPAAKSFLRIWSAWKEIIPCSAEQCTCGKCGAERKIIGYDTAEVLTRKPVEYFVRVISSRPGNYLLSGYAAG